MPATTDAPRVIVASHQSDGGLSHCRQAPDQCSECRGKIHIREAGDERIDDVRTRGGYGVRQGGVQSGFPSDPGTNARNSDAGSGSETFDNRCDGSGRGRGQDTAFDEQPKGN
jgi:hypothetical protein